MVGIIEHRPDPRSRRARRRWTLVMSRFSVADLWVICMIKGAFVPSIFDFRTIFYEGETIP
jgi:hypothetical protein